MRLRRLLVWGATALAPSIAVAQMPAGGSASPYAGEESRAIKSLSAEDIAELRRGGGWGLARVAELNGMPGPAHLIELQAKIPLTAEQLSKVQALFGTMQENAIREGETLIAAEQTLEDAFRSRSVDETNLAEMLVRIERARTALRAIHLTAHLATARLLTSAQVDRYNALRGYRPDACATVPQGRDPTFWKQHHNRR